MGKHLETAIANLTAAQDEFDGIAEESSLARAALKRSKSKANVSRYAAASEAFDSAFDKISALHEAADDAEALDAAEEAAALTAADAALEPELAF